MQLKPPNLFQRFLLIIVVPIIVLQLSTSLIFYKRHWENISQHMKEALIADFMAIIFYIKTDSTRLTEAQDLSSILGIEISYQQRTKLKDVVKYPLLTDYDLKNFSDLLTSSLPYESEVFYSAATKSDIITVIELEHGVIEFKFGHKKIQSPTTMIFYSWIFGISLLLILIAVVFMKNQVRSILKLAEAAELLGKGQEITSFKPSGAKEVKKAGVAFLRMKNRIARQIQYRTDLLAHISHDLRTPLTRLKLQTALLNDKTQVAEMNKDIKEMEKMIDCYLNFAKEEGNEDISKTDIVKLISKVVQSYKDERVTLILKCKSHIFSFRNNAFKRAFQNILENALKYCKSKVVVKIRKGAEHIYISVDDDGKGIPEDQYHKVFKPFYKINEKSSGFGLGLAIVKSVIYSHGGRIYLSKSELGGLKMKIKLPL